jgi:hypothetical protein
VLIKARGSGGRRMQVPSRYTPLAALIWHKHARAHVCRSPPFIESRVIIHFQPSTFRANSKRTSTRENFTGCQRHISIRQRLDSSAMQRARHLCSPKCILYRGSCFYFTSIYNECWWKETFFTMNYGFKKKNYKATMISRAKIYL